MQPGHGHAAWTWTCCLDMGIRPGHGMDMYIELDIDTEIHRKKIKKLYKTLFTSSFWLNMFIISLFIFYLDVKNKRYTLILFSAFVKLFYYNNVISYLL